MINEQFMSEQQIVSDLKWRVSLGQTGNSNIGNNALALYATKDNHYNFGDQQSIGVAQSQLANPNLKWERKYTLDYGVEILDFSRTGFPVPWNSLPVVYLICWMKRSSCNIIRSVR